MHGVHSDDVYIFRAAAVGIGEPGDDEASVIGLADAESALVTVPPVRIDSQRILLGCRLWYHSPA
ncbi:MAG: hypothetical protein H8E87_08375, partial [FCB group bacterium]|nr:hypothetical protein [FCB group bacterium]